MLSALMMMRTNITFQLEDKSQGKNMTYVPVDGEGITADGKVKILSADIEENRSGRLRHNPLHLLRRVRQGISLDVMDLNGNLWQLSDLGGGSEVAESEKKPPSREAIRKRTLPTKSEYGGYGSETNTTYEPVK